MVRVISVVINRQAIRPASHKGSGKQKAIISFTVGLTAIVLSGVHLSRATGDFGTGPGRLGTIVALTVVLIGVVPGGLALAR